MRNNQDSNDHSEHPQFSNQFWYTHVIPLRIEILDCFLSYFSPLFLVIWEDVYSSCVMGAYLADCSTPLEAALALSLRHAILGKPFIGDNSPVSEYCYPNNLLFEAKHSFSVTRFAVEFDIAIHPLKIFPIIKKRQEIFNRIIQNFLACHWSDQEDGKPQRKLDVTKQELNQRIFDFIAVNYNRRTNQFDQHRTRVQRWEAGLLNGKPEVLEERSLDLLLPRSSGRKVYRSGCVRFENWIYRDVTLSTHVGENVFVRYHPDNIVSIFVYQIKDGKEVLIARPFIVDFHEEVLSLHDSRTIWLNIRKQNEMKANEMRIKEMSLELRKKPSPIHNP